MNAIARSANAPGRPRRRTYRRRSPPRGPRRSGGRRCGRTLKGTLLALGRGDDHRVAGVGGLAERSPASTPPSYSRARSSASTGSSPQPAIDVSWFRVRAPRVPRRHARCGRHGVRGRRAVPTSRRADPLRPAALVRRDARRAVGRHGACRPIPRVVAVASTFRRASAWRQERCGRRQCSHRCPTASRSTSSSPRCDRLQRGRGRTSPATSRARRASRSRARRRRLRAALHLRAHPHQLDPPHGRAGSRASGQIRPRLGARHRPSPVPSASAVALGAWHGGGRDI